MSPPRPLRVSVVIPTCHRPALLRRCLEALRRQTIAPVEYEVIVVDDGASPDTERVVRRSAARPGPLTRYLATAGRRGPAAARNLGWQSACAPIIAFTDDDCIPAPTWLAAGLAAIETGCEAVSGRVVVPRPLVPTDYERNIGRLEDAEFVTANCVCRRAALERIGGFDERFTAAWREDSDLQFSLLEHGARVGVAPDCLVYHPVRAARWGVSLSEQRKSRFNALLFRKHPDLYRERIQPRPPWRYYGIVAALVTAAVALLLGNPALAAAAGLVWLVLTGAFFLDRIHGTRKTASHVLEMAVTSVLIPVLAVFWRLNGSVRYRARFL